MEVMGIFVGEFADSVICRKNIPIVVRTVEEKKTALNIVHLAICSSGLMDTPASNAFLKTSS